MSSKFNSNFQRLIWKTKYCAPSDNNNILEFWCRIANALSSEEEDFNYWSKMFFHALKDFKVSFGGRIMANAGRDDVNTTLINCFGAQGYNVRDLDSLDGIMSDMWLVAKTLQSEGGWGGNFSYIRPKGTVIKGTGTQTPGAVKFMELFDQISAIITADVISTGYQGKRKKVASRKGAMMGVLDIWHPDIEEFITAKQIANRLSKFNLSVGVSDEFMLALKANEMWDLVFPDIKHEKYANEWDGDLSVWKDKGYPIIKYKKIKARDLWDLIMSSTYGRNEPGVIFLDRMNAKNNLFMIGDVIRSTNPCGEIPTASKITEEGSNKVGGDVCDLGSINLTKFINAEKNDFDWYLLSQHIYIMIRGLDNVLDISSFPVAMYERASRQRRKIGLGFMGFASALFILHIKYGSQEAVDLLTKLTKFFSNESYKASTKIAREKGCFPLWDVKLMDGGFIKYAIDENIFDKETIDLIKTYGLRNSALNALAPNGNTSIYCGVVSGGHEPVFNMEYNRWFILEDKRGFPYPDVLPNTHIGEWHETKNFKFTKEGNETILLSKCGNYKIDKNRGLTKKEKVVDYGYANCGVTTDEKQHFLVGSQDLSVSEHLDMHLAVAKNIDQSVSKTVNLPKDYPFNEFKDLYYRVWEEGGKGITTYRQGTMATVLDNNGGKKVNKNEIKKSSLEILFASAGDKVIPSNTKIPDEAYAKQIKIKAEGKKWHISMVFADKALTKPFAIFITTNSTEPTTITEKAVEDLVQLAKNEGVYEKHIDIFNEKLKRKNNITKIARAIGFCLRHNIKIIKIVGVLEEQKVVVTSIIFQLRKLLSKYIKDGTGIKNERCLVCKGQMVFQSGCKICKDCGWGAC